MKVRRGVLFVAAFLLIWSLVVLLTGGFVIEAPWRPISSRAPLRPFLAGALLVLFYAVRWRQHAPGDLGPLGGIRVPVAIGVMATLAALVTGMARGARIAGGPDPSGYVSQAALIARGELTLPAPQWLLDATWTDAARAASPVGYGPSARPGRLAPVYSPGLPLLMALASTVAGPRAVFFVVPLLAGAAAWAAYRLGTLLGSSWAGAIAALLLVTSPTFVAMTLQTMSDVPAAAFWTMALVASLQGHGVRAGLAAGAAILIRPNLVLLAAAPAGLLLLSSTGPLRRAALFACAAGPAAVAIAALNWYYYGSPLQSGYGSFGYLYSMARVGANLRQYAGWFVDSQTPWLALGVLAPAVVPVHRRERARLVIVTTVFPALVTAMYLPYLLFQPHEWQYLRFVLPGYPALMAGFGLVVVSLTRRVPWRGREIPAAIVVTALAAHGWTYTARAGVLGQQESDRRYAHAVAYARSLPPHAVLVSLAHSGTLRFYTGRDVLRLDAIGGYDIDLALSHLESRGHDVYLIGDPFEIDMFRDRFGGTEAAARLAQARAVDLGGSLAYRLSARSSRTP